MADLLAVVWVVLCAYRAVVGYSLPAAACPYPQPMLVHLERVDWSKSDPEHRMQDPVAMWRWVAVLLLHRMVAT